ncbi:MAG: hypothetical protein UR28_C0017G0016 [Candidatus Peregrinibacteria bacterium GW2011_GWF2_33_10]|nr:MAG: hypothetical protein UR28_C0017G0016 [Candidatus Peregrinibacteria bacterium GW2011_GWF2_33_10]OGJ44570.1 MAG: hypothetical protein A2263_02560 [Candidatus Peregrinibacteria bacterium RIFOXYA2_FULL_33_21]OGJ44876.1 MAG: hypothetical protein A2272_01870 [Candidatus Peregrinibacteria bacterium RIFOXYA12_FULL_33_12]OGJ50043.1 MAG: hypothetical protein A2307_01420 [Candidatus Peregrinibacteria bacterium RIFOXYB2_FULL_33_20]
MNKILTILIIGAILLGSTRIISNSNFNSLTPPKNSDVKSLIIHNVPFAAQAALGNWEDERQADGCEEASTLMAMMWIKNFNLTKEEAKTMIIKISDYEKNTYGSYVDTSIEDSAKRIIEGYFGYKNYKLIYDFDLQTLINKIYDGNIIILPVNGNKLANPHFRIPGPVKHMLVLVGYDPETKKFITNDPGTKFGQQYKYDEQHLYDVIKNYQTTNHNESLTDKSAILLKKYIF